MAAQFQHTVQLVAESASAEAVEQEIGAGIDDHAHFSHGVGLINDVLVELKKQK